MKMRQVTKFGMLVLGVLFIASKSLAADLIETYNDALANDPTFKLARANWLADRERLAISQASLLPQIAVNLDWKGHRKIGVEDWSASRVGSLGYGLSISQPIFDFGRLASVWGTQATVKRAQAMFMAAEEELLYRTAEKYFDVLLAKEVLAYTQAHRAANERLLIQAKHKHEVGLTPITDLEEARRNHKQAISAELKSRNDLDTALELLQEITGVKYQKVSSLKKSFPLLAPKPAELEAWVKAAERQNFSLIATRYGVVQAQENIKMKQAGHLPTINLAGGYRNEYQSVHDVISSSRDQAATVGLAVTMPIFAGGRVTAEVRQAMYQYQGALAELERCHRGVVSGVRQAYLGTWSGISQIKADLQAIKAAESALKAMQANYAVGRKTMTEVLDAQSKLYAAQTGYAKDEHSYILLMLKLKMLVGSLKVADLVEVNTWIESQPR